MIYKDILDAILAYAGQGGGGDFEDLVKVVCNGVYRRVLDSGVVPHEERVFTLTSVAATSQYGMPLYVRKILNIEDPTSPRFVWSTTAREQDRALPGSTTSGTPDRAFSLGMRGVEKYPASDGALTLVSDAAGDDGSSYKIRVAGFNTSGVMVTELIEADGTTAVSTANSYDSTLGVERVTKYPASGFAFSGNVTVRDSDSNIIAIIPVWWDSPDYEWVQFFPIPSAAIVYNIRCEMRKPPLVNDSDWPEFDQEFHDLLIWGTTQDLLPTVGKGTTADRHRLTFKERMKEFLGVKDSDPRAIWVFSDVQNAIGIRQRPRRPLVEGVDIGLARTP